MKPTAARRLGLAAITLAALLLVACSTTARGTWHVVQRGENLYRIANYYGVPVADILESNSVPDARDIRVGTEIWIPGAGDGRPPPGPLVPPPAVLRELARNGGSGSTLARGQFDWPVRGGTLTSRYGVRRGRMHQGIDIGAHSGTPIHSAGDGKVIFSSRLGAYGNV